MNKFLVVLFGLLMSITAYAVPQRVFQDLKLPSQKMVEKQSFANLTAAGTANVLSAHAGATSAAVATATTFVAQPDVPRNLSITPGGTTTDVEACDVTVSGTNIKNKAITEVFSFLANASTATVGAKAFKTVTSVSWAANCESGGFAATWSVGFGEKIGLKSCLDNAGDIFFSLLNGAKEGTAPTMVISASAVESNTADFNGSMQGTNDFVLYFMQNYCL